MRRLTIEEQRHILDVLVHQHFGAGMMEMDSICYGGPVEDFAEAERHLRRAINAFPGDILNEYHKEIRKQQADKLRAEADAIEQGKNI